MKRNPFEQFNEASSVEQLQELQQFVKYEGYSFFHRILEGLHDKIKHFIDEEAEDMTQMIAKAKTCFPYPGQISPSWELIWHELEQIVAHKIKVLQSVSVNDREGVWQVIMDNPYTNQEVVCYPSLSFLEATYLFGYFRPGLEKNEYIEIQKVQSILMENGS